jgi:putative transposase
VKKRFSDDQIVTILRELDTQGKSIEDTCKRHNITVQTFYLWRRRFGSLQENEAKRLREMEPVPPRVAQDSFHAK